MSFDVLGDLNWLAVIVATLAYFLLGAVWYARAVFGKAWQQSSGITVEEGQRPGAAFYIIPLTTCLLMTLATAMIAASTGSSTVGDAIVLGLVVGVGFAASLSLLGSAFGNYPQPGVYFAITAGYHLVGLMGASLIVTLWD
ncbi:MAG: DUF1761 domain-containing protein [Actinomycetota bacterium]